MKHVLLLAIILTIAISCSWDSEELLYPESEYCDTINVSFSGDVTPILAANCYECHSNTNAPDFAYGIALEDFKDVKASLDLIVGAIKQIEGFPAMPKGADKLDTCSINTIEAWVNIGAPDN